MRHPRPDPVGPVFTEDWGRLVAGLIGWCGDFELAEEAAADAFAAAAQRWPAEGRPDAPFAWLTTVARNRVRDRLRRRATERAKLPLLVEDDTTEAPEPPEDVPDDRLRLIFTCCHPALAMPARVALTLRTLGGLTSAEIARAFLVTETTMDKRLVRARAKIRNAGIPYRVPPAPLLPERLQGVLAVLYLMFNEGYAATTDPAVVRPDVTAEAIRLTRLVRALLPGATEPAALLALMLLTDARRAARIRDGAIVLLNDQDRSRWDRRAIAEGAALLRELAAVPDSGPPSAYEVQARIALEHDRAARPEDTDWAVIARLYRLLPRTAVTELNRAVAVSMVDGPQAGLDLIAPLASELGGYHLYAATEADFLIRLGRIDQARAALERAAGLTRNPSERRLLEARGRAL